MSLNSELTLLEIIKKQLSNGLCCPSQIFVNRSLTHRISVEMFSNETFRIGNCII